MDYEENEGGKTSRYNSGVAQIMRLDELWKDTHKHARAGQLDFWNWDLDRIWLELVGDLKEDDKRIEEFNSFKIGIGDINKKLIDKSIPFEEYKRLRYELLMSKEEFLRRLQNKLGKGTALMDEDEDFID